MPLDTTQLTFLKTLNIPSAPDLGPKLYEILTKAFEGVNNMAQQTDSDPTGDPPPPPGIDSVQAEGQNGILKVAINHGGAKVFRGVEYFVEHADNSQFTNAQLVSLGPSRNGQIYVGNAQAYVRTFAQYPGSPPGEMATFGGPSQPRMVIGGGSAEAIRFMKSMGSGTGTPGETHVGYGRTPYRSSNGRPPVR